MLYISIMEKQTTRGGARPGAGRKPKKDKKVPIFSYVEGSYVDAVGGKLVAKAISEKAIIRAAKNILK
jgi:hypothetical protein